MSDQETRDRRKRKRDFRKNRPRKYGQRPKEHAPGRGDNVFHDPSDPYTPLDFHDEQE